MYFISYFYVSVTDDAPKCPRAETSARVGPAPNYPDTELAVSNQQCRVVPFRAVHSDYGEDTGVLLNSVIYTASVIRTFDKNMWQQK